MKSQRPSGREPRPVSSGLKFGETGDTWGNLRLDGSGLEIDQRFYFDDDPGRRVYQVTRVLPDPLEPQKRVLFYEAIARDPWPGEPR